MGNTESNVTSGVKKQAGVSTQKLYKLVNLKGGGLLVDMMSKKKVEVEKCKKIIFLSFNRASH
jgi:hypothetical protein